MSGEEIHAWSLLGMNGQLSHHQGISYPPGSRECGGRGRVESLPQDDRINNQV